MSRIASETETCSPLPPCRPSQRPQPEPHAVWPNLDVIRRLRTSPMNAQQMTSHSARHQRIKPLGEVMLDRSLVALGFAFCLVAVHVCMVLNVFLRPTLSIISLVLGSVVLCAFWFRAAAAVFRAWSDPSARVVRFASIGALLLTLWPASMLVIVTLMPPESD